MRRQRGQSRGRSIHQAARTPSPIRSVSPNRTDRRTGAGGRVGWPSPSHPICSSRIGRRTEDGPWIEDSSRQSVRQVIQPNQNRPTYPRDTSRRIGDGSRGDIPNDDRPTSSRDTFRRVEDAARGDTPNDFRSISPKDTYRRTEAVWEANRTSSSRPTYPSGNDLHTEDNSREGCPIHHHPNCPRCNVQRTAVGQKSTLANQACRDFSSPSNEERSNHPMGNDRKTGGESEEGSANRVREVSPTGTRRRTQDCEEECTGKECHPIDRPEYDSESSHCRPAKAKSNHPQMSPKHSPPSTRSCLRFPGRPLAPPDARSRTLGDACGIVFHRCCRPARRDAGGRQGPDRIRDPFPRQERQAHPRDAGGCFFGIHRRKRRRRRGRV